MYKNVLDYSVITYEDRTREKITDFDGNVSYSDWKVIKTYTKQIIDNRYFKIIINYLFIYIQKNYLDYLY